jgi:hypothetical protein
MSGRVTKSQRRRWNGIELGPHEDMSKCPDLHHAKYVSNARALLMMLGPDHVPAVLDCGCPFFVFGYYK